MIETKRFDDSLTGRIVFPAGWKQAQKKEERKLHAVYRVLRAIHTDVIPTRTLSLPPSPGRRSREIPDENRQRDPRGYRPLFHICMHVVIPPLENSSRFGNRFEFERCTNVSRINSFHLSKRHLFERDAIFFAHWNDTEWWWIKCCIYIFSFEAKLGLISVVRDRKLSCEHPIVVDDSCASRNTVYTKKEKKKREHTEEEKKEKPESHEHTRAPNVCETLPRQRGKKKFSNPFSTTRRWNAALKYALHTSYTLVQLGAILHTPRWLFTRPREHGNELLSYEPWRSQLFLPHILIPRHERYVN